MTSLIKASLRIFTPMTKENHTELNDLDQWIHDAIVEIERSKARAITAPYPDERQAKSIWLLPRMIRDSIKVSGRIRRDCWIWEGDTHANARGLFHLNQQTLFADELVYRLLVGPLAEGQRLIHLCESPRCVSPHHLRLSNLQKL